MEEFYYEIGMGARYRMEENFSKALEHFNNAIILQPYNFEGYLERGVNFHLRNQTLFALRDFQYALHHCTESFACQAPNKSLHTEYFKHILQGLIYETNNLWQKAVPEYETALKCDQQGFYAYFSIGYSYGSLSLVLDPNNPTNNEQLYKDAIKFFTKALHLIDVIPHHRNYYSFYSSVIYTNVAWMHKRLENNQQALSCYKKAIELNPRHIRAHFSRAILHRSMDLKQQAVADYTACIEIFEEQFMQLVYLEGMKHRTSLKAVKKRIASLLEDRGLTNMDDQESATAAKDDFTRAIKLCPSEAPFAYLILSFTYTHNGGEYTGALRVLEEGVRCCSQYGGMTNDPQTYKDLARMLSFKSDILSAVGRTKEAGKDLKLVEQLNNLIRID
jgi:tetratricopeptide (TPR) repeat protein